MMKILVVRLLIVFSVLLPFAAGAQVHCADSFATQKPERLTRRPVALTKISRFPTPEARLAHQLKRNETTLKETFDQYNVIRANFQKYRKGEFKAPNGQPMSVYLIQQLSLKFQNEYVWSIPDTSMFLEHFHLELYRYLELNPDYGHVINVEFRHHFVVSSLNYADFRDLVLTPVMHSLASFLEGQKSSLAIRQKLGAASWSWDTFIEQNVRVTDHTTLLRAHVKMAFSRFSEYSPKYDSFETWRAAALPRRSRLSRAAALNSVPWADILSHTHDFNRGVYNRETTQKWLAERGMANYAMDFFQFCDDLRVANFLQLNVNGPAFNSWKDLLELRTIDPSSVVKTNWMVDRRIFMELVQQRLRAEGSGHLAMSDFRGLGRQVLAEQDRWIREGARLATLDTVFSRVNSILHKFFIEIESNLSGIVKAKIPFYYTGDDGIWYFPKLTPIQKAAITRYFNKRSLTPTMTVDGDPELMVYFSGLIDVKSPAPEEIARAHQAANHGLMKQKKIIEAKKVSSN